MDCLEDCFKKNKSDHVSGYFFEITENNSLYRTFVEDKDELKKLMKAWCVERKDIDVGNYEKILDL